MDRYTLEDAEAEANKPTNWLQKIMDFKAWVTGVEGREVRDINPKDDEQFFDVPAFLREGWEIETATPVYPRKENKNV